MSWADTEAGGAAAARPINKHVPCSFSLCDQEPPSSVGSPRTPHLLYHDRPCPAPARAACMGLPIMGNRLFDRHLGVGIGARTGQEDARLDTPHRAA